MSRTPVRLVHVMTVPQTFVLLGGQASYMQRHGFDITAVASAGPYAAVFAAQENVEVVTVEMSRRITPVADLRALAQLIGVLRATRPTIVHAHTPKGGLLGMLAAWSCRVPVRVYHLRGLPLETATGPRRLLLTACEWLCCALADRVFCVSHSLRDRAVSLGVVAADKIVVPRSGSGNGVDAVSTYNPACLAPSTRGELRREWGVADDAVVVAFVGRISRDKGIVELCAMWQKLRADFPDAHLVIAGPIDDTHDSLPESVLASLRADPRVKLLGLLDDARAVYAAVDVVVHPSHREGFPNVPLEAAAMRLPVITTTATGCRDAVVDGLTGRVVPVGDVEAIADAVREYMADPVLREQHGRAGRERALRDFDPERIWTVYLAEYRALMGDGRPTARDLGVSDHQDTTHSTDELPQITHCET